MSFSDSRLLALALTCFALALPAASALAAGPSTKEVTNSIGMKLVRIEPGSFVMGQDGPPSDYRMVKHPARFDDADWDEKPAHKVTISTPFHIAATEVTLGQYRQFKPEHGKGEDTDPVTEVSWNDATAFCEWLSAKEGRTYRLPTEAEWEYACRAGTTTLFHTGDALPEGFHKWHRDTVVRKRFFPDDKLPAEYQPASSKASLKVAQTPPNAWGLYDMHGNVSEWCADWYGPYEKEETANPFGRSEGDFRVIRGGSHSVFTRFLRSESCWLAS
ncbi:MAG: formylglycine-generating enzyme family protein [Roseimicrobium sp.]